MDDHKEENRDDTDEVAEKSFLKLKLTMEKDGYREGIEEGRNKLFQKYFDEGYRDGCHNGFSLGQLKGATWAKNIFNQIKPSRKKELPKSSAGACFLCQDEKHMSFPLSMIQLNQKEVIQTIQKMKEEES